MDRKGLIIGTIIGIMLGVGISYASGLFRVIVDVSVTVPDRVSMQIDGVTARTGDNTYTFELEPLSTNVSEKWLYLWNNGSEDLTLTYSVENLPDGLAVEFRPETYRNDPCTEITIERGVRYPVLFKLTDEGAKPGDYTFKIIFEEV